MYLMHRDTPVLEVSNSIKVLNKDLLPYALKKDTITFDDFYGDFLSYRALSISRSHAKELIQRLKISQNNSVKISLAAHSVSYSDCYWTKEDNEELTWKDVSLFQTPPNEDIAKLAFSGEGPMFHIHKLHTPELTTQGASAKCWNWRNNQCFLYKVSRKELAASELLDQLGFTHLAYVVATPDEVNAISPPEKHELIDKAGEIIVKCLCMTSEEISLLAFEEYAVFCENNGTNPYDFVKENFPERYNEMILIDYIFGNPDRHIGNWGFLYHADTMDIIGLHPLMDHDRAFSNEDLFTQTLERDIAMKDAVMTLSLSKDVLNKIKGLTRPTGLTDAEWHGVKKRANIVVRQQQAKRITDLTLDENEAGAELNFHRRAR